MIKSSNFTKCDSIFICYIYILYENLEFEPYIDILTLLLKYLYKVQILIFFFIVT